MAWFGLGKKKPPPALTPEQMRSFNPAMPVPPPPPPEKPRKGTAMSSVSDFLSKIGGMKKEEAYFAILLTAMYIDGKEHPTEREELVALAHRTKTLSALSEADVLGYWEKLKPRLERTEIAKLVEDACRALPSDMRPSVFAHACDIIFADREIVHEEQQLIVKLTELMQLPEQTATAILQTLSIKNEY
jgi:uncharacterized tellurite resistance protein B-like protein